MSQTQYIEAHLIKLLSDFSVVPSNKINLTSSIAMDLNIEGDDAKEFFDKLSSEFDVDISDIKLSDYFVGESKFNPVSVLFDWVAGHREEKMALTVQDVVNLIKERIAN
jgi:acyl carrier protein